MMLLLCSLSVLSCSSLQTVTATTGAGIGVPNHDQTRVYDRNVTIGVNNKYYVGGGNSRIFGDYGHLGVAHKGYYLGWTNYHNDWGHWVTVKKTFTLWKNEKTNKKDSLKGRYKLRK